MPLSVKLHRVHIEIGHHIASKKGKLVSLAELKEKFSTHRLSDAIWTLIEQRVITEPQPVKYPGFYQTTQEGQALLEEQWESLQEMLAKKKGNVPEIAIEDDPKDRKLLREQEKDLQARKAREDEEAAGNEGAEAKDNPKAEAKGTKLTSGRA